MYPAAGLLDYAPGGASVYLIDPATTTTRPNVRHIPTGASEGVRHLANLLGA